MLKLIKNGRIITADGEKRADILIQDEIILSVEDHLEVTPFIDTVIDASHLILLPGGIDVHTHLELPLGAIRSRDTFITGSTAAIYGGTTTLIDFATQERGESPLKAYDRWMNRAEGRCYTDFSFHMAITDLQECYFDDIKILIERGVTSFKVYMAYPSLMLSCEKIEKLARLLKEHHALLMVHAEMGEELLHRIDHYIKIAPQEPLSHRKAHNRAIEVKAVKKLCEISLKLDTFIYIVHTTSKEAIETIVKSGAKIIVESCPHYLVLDDSHYDAPFSHSAKYVMSPPLRKKSDIEALWQAIADGQIACVATDHCSFNYSDEKTLGLEDFSLIPNGVAGLEDRLRLLYTYGVLQKRISLFQMQAVFATSPAQIFGLKTKGEIVAGKDADIVFFNQEHRSTLSVNSHHHAIDHSIYEGFEVYGRIEKVIRRGEIFDTLMETMPSQRNGKFQKRSTLARCNSKE